MKKQKIAFIGTPRQDGGLNYVYVLVDITTKTQDRQPEGAARVSGKKYQLVALDTSLQKAGLKVGDEIPTYKSNDILETAPGAAIAIGVMKGNMSIKDTITRTKQIYKESIDADDDDIIRNKIWDAAQLGVTARKAASKANVVARRTPVFATPELKGVGDN